MIHVTKHEPVQCGLTGRDGPVPLRGVRVDARIEEFCARVTIAQRYRNEETFPIEAVYTFPLDEGAAVCGFEALIDGVHVVGEVMEREAAFATYDDAMEEGHGAYLLDQERPDVFVASIGNLPPGKEVLIRITYVTELQAEGEDIRFTLPTTVAPRYAPASDSRGVSPTPAETLNPPIGWDVPYSLELEVSLEMGGRIRGVESPSHPIRADLDGSRATVRLSSRSVALDRDFVLLVRREADGPVALVEETEGGGKAVVVAFVPRLEDDRTVPSEVIFIVDRSGSMDGPSIEEARNALQLCLRSLAPGSYFNVVGFGSSFEMMFPKSRAYSDDSLREAARRVDAMAADLGGTKILAPLEAILGAPARSGMARQVLILTDGEVTNTDAVIDLVRRNAGTTRVFTFAIGAGPSHHLLRAVARAGQGAAESIHPGERIEEKVMRQMKRVLAPGFTEVGVDWGEMKVRQAPRRLPAVFSGSRLLVYGFVDGGVSGVVHLRMREAGGPKLSLPVRIDLERAQPGRVVGTLAARSMIRDLEESSGDRVERRGSQQRGRRTQATYDQIARLGTAYGLVSSATSFVAVERRDVVSTERAVLRRVPINLPNGWGGVRENVAFLARSAPTGARYVEAPKGMAFCLGDSSEPSKVYADYDRASASSPPPASSRFGGLAILRLQRADGTWELDKQLATELGVRLRDLTASLPGPDSGTDVRTAWATVLAIAHLELRHADQRILWELAVKKGLDRLEQIACVAGRVEDWRRRATELLDRAENSAHVIG